MTDDLVPRLNAHTLGSLRRELLEVDWAGQLLQQLGGRQVMQGVREAVEGVRQAVGLGPGLLQLAQAVLPPDLAARWAVGGARLKLATPLLNPPPVPADASSAAASAEQHLPSGNNSSGGYGFTGNTVGRTTAMDLAPNTSTSTSSEPDLTRWAEMGRAAVHGLNAQLASLSPRLPAAAKDALVAVFSATNVAEVLRVAGVLTTQTRAWQAKPGTLGPPSPKRASQSPSPYVEGGQEGRRDAPAPVLLPAGQLYHVRPAAADAEAWEVVEVDVEAPYFDLM
ncbi:hypothetical protein HaLaN_10377 [Haematococcus lacustris]|uniref:Uncharacterized protein n=1 Tax=Haematococcus lacustris TaxID=44745 RepID=A0A699Z612_HAELA|nr:hypothetical protein HaLaN_10377 [Haematococcus lacustris]